MKLGGGVALPPRIPGKASSEAVTGGERADDVRGGGFGRVSRIVAEAMAEVDAKMLALPNPPSSPLLGSSARHLPACRGFSGLKSSGRAGGLLPEPRRGPGDKHHGPRAGLPRLGQERKGGDGASGTPFDRP